MVENDSLAARCELLASTAISNCETIADAGKRLGWSPSTTYRLSGTPLFRIAYSTRLLEVADVITAQAVSLHGKALQRLGELVASPDERVACDASGKLLGIFSKMFDAIGRQQLAAIESIETLRAIEANSFPFTTTSQQSRN